MFTGLIETMGKVRSVRRSGSLARIEIESSIKGLEVGESIAVNGVCQTVVSFRGAVFGCDVMQETLRSTTLGRLRRGSVVNLERAVKAQDRLGGHIVTGHVDCVGRVLSVVRRPYSVEIEIPGDLIEFVVPKGSVAVNGVSLTVGPDVEDNRFSVNLIPHTISNTNLSLLKPGDEVNVEVDIIAKYVKNFMDRHDRK